MHYSVSNLYRRISRVTSEEVLVYPLTEASGTFASEGNNTATLAVQGSPNRGVTSIFSKGMWNTGAARDGAEGAASVQPVYPIRVSIWVMARKWSNQMLFAKQYRNDNTWAGVFTTWRLYINNATDGSWYAQIATGADGAGAATQLTIAAATYKFPLDRWTLVGFTYDGAALTAFIDGMQVGTTACSGAIDYNTSVAGPYCVGAIKNTGNPAPGDALEGLYCDARLAAGGTVASAAGTWFQEAFRRGMGWLDDVT